MWEIINNAVARSHTKQRDKPNNGSDWKNAAGEVGADHAANRGQRQIEHNDQRVFVWPERSAKDQENADDDADAPQGQALVDALQAFKLPSVLDTIALRQLQCLTNPLFNFLNCATQIAPYDIALHHNPALHTLAHDEVRAAILLDVRDAP
jgi:hypothetical protein